MPDVSKIAEPVPKNEPRSQYGNKSPYSVLGESYRVLPNCKDYVERGLASWYGNKFNGYTTSNFEKYDMYAYSAASKVLPLPCYVRVTNLQTGRNQAFGDRAVFIAGRCDDWRRDARTRDADIVLAHGVLHHVDDEEFLRILEFARAALKPDGRFVFYEPCYLIWQSRLSAFLMSHDRGQHIRKEQEWKELAGRVFPRITTSIVTSTNLLGYTCIIGECRTR